MLTTDFIVDFNLEILKSFKVCIILKRPHNLRKSDNFIFSPALVKLC